MIYVSTGGFNNLSFYDVAKKLKYKGSTIKNIELSSGIYCDNLDVKLIDISETFNITLHNYFPVPKNPFVFNLASNNKIIKKLSLEHAKKAIEISSKFGAKYYTFHAGYLLDPKVDELGNSIKKKDVISYTDGLNNFIENVNYLSEFAFEKNVKLMIENNVLSYENSKNFSNNPLLCVDKEGTKDIFSRVNENVGLLVDLAHLKVSAQSLSFDPIDYLLEFDNIIKGYHFSDNCGQVDSNQPFTEKSWFWPYINKRLDYYTIEVYTNSISQLEQQYDFLNKFINEK